MWRQNWKGLVEVYENKYSQSIVLEAVFTLTETGCQSITVLKRGWKIYRQRTQSLSIFA